MVVGGRERACRKHAAAAQNPDVRQDARQGGPNSTFLLTIEGIFPLLAATSSESPIAVGPLLARCLHACHPRPTKPFCWARVIRTPLELKGEWPGITGTEQWGTATTKVPPTYINSFRHSPKTMSDIVAAANMHDFVYVCALVYVCRVRFLYSSLFSIFSFLSSSSAGQIFHSTPTRIAIP